MYQSHWGLRDSPFRTFDPAAFYESPTHEEALARLHFLVEHRHRLGLLLGPSGCGKSLLLEVFAREVRREGRAVAKVELVGVEPAEVLWQLAIGLGVDLEPTDSVPRLWQTLADQIATQRYQQRDTVVLLDDADMASQGVLVQVGRLARHDPSSDSRLTVVLAGRSERMGCLGADLLGRVDLRIELEPWAAEDTRRFVTESLARSGARGPVFADGALARLQDLSRGLPRRVGQLADLALAAGAGRQADRIDEDLVQAAYEELSVGV